MGDTGTNDLGTPIVWRVLGWMMQCHRMPEPDCLSHHLHGIQTRASVPFRRLKIYLAAALLQDISCTNAWHAVGVGNPFVAAVISDFSASTTSVCSLNNTVHFTNLSVNGENFEWDFGDGTTSTDINPAHTYTAEGTFNVSLFVDGGTCGEDSLLQVNYITVALPIFQPHLIPAPAPIHLAVHRFRAASPLQLPYEDPIGGIPIGSGSPFFTPPVTATTIFYAENDVFSAPQAADPITNNFGTGGYFTFTNQHYVIFDAYDNFLLQSVTVYANQSGVRTIELLDNGGNLLNELTSNIANGTVVVPLNFEVAAGTVYQLGLQDGSMSNLYRNQAGSKFSIHPGRYFPLLETIFRPRITIIISITGRYKSSCTSLRVPVKS